MRAVEVTSERHIECLRVLRNSGREWFLNDTSEITSEQQTSWWERNSNSVIAYLFYEGDSLVGYCMVRHEHGKWWDSIVVSPDFRGRGYGKRMLRYVVSLVGGPVWSKVRSDNVPSLKIHDGWDKVIERSGVVVFRTISPGPTPDVP